MKALLTLKSAINQSSVIAFATLVSLLSVIYPEMALAASIQTPGQSALVFEIKDPNLIQQSAENQNTQLTYDQTVQNDPLVTKITTFLEKYNSPLAPYAPEIIQQPQWQRALAISWVESNMGQHCVDNNCSGMGGAPGSSSWRKYSTKLDWFKDMCQLMEQPVYKDRLTTFAKMRGFYVQPGSDAWVNGAQAKYDELMALTAEAQQQKLALANNSVSTAYIGNIELASLQ